MTRKQTYETLVGFEEFSTCRLCDVEYYFTQGYPQTMDSPEEYPAVEVVGVFYEGVDVTSFVELSEVDRIADEICEAIGQGSFNEPEEYIYE